MNSDECQANSSDPLIASSKWTWLLPLALIAGVVGLYFVWPGFHNFVIDAYRALTSEDSQKAREWVAQYGAWGPLVILAGMLIQTIVPVIPSIILMVVAVLAYGTLKGGALAWGGVIVAAMLAYGIGRAISCVTLERMLGSKTQRKVSHAVDRYGLWAVIAARISPVISTDAISLIAGLGAMGFWKFLIATALGTLPLAVLIAWLGRDWERMKGGLIWISAISLVVFAIYVAYDHRQRKQRGVT